MRLATTAQMRALEQAAVDAGATWDGLMEQAGWGVAQEALRLLGPAAGRRVLILVGPGNNGGDGLVAARHLHDAGAVVTLYLWRRRCPEGDANWQRCRTRAIRETVAESDPRQTTLRDLAQEADLIVDALLGMGISRPLEGELAAIVETVNAVRAERASTLRVLAVDLPTGVNSDTGAVEGAAIRADVTVATGLPKRGLLLFPGRDRVGRLVLAEIGIPAHALEEVMSAMLTAEEARRLAPARPADAHKGSFGKVLVVAGSLNYPGAAFLACAGAARVGAGLVTLASGRTVLLAGGRPLEVTLLPLAEGDWGAIGPNAVEELEEHLAGYAALLLGPGLGAAECTREFVLRLFGLERPRSKTRVGFVAGTLADEPAVATKLEQLPPTVLDADGLNILATVEAWHERLPRKRFVLTPHPGEMRRLLKVESLPGDPLAVATDAAARWGQVVVLKGATTVIAAPDGRSLVYSQPNPALATAGTGDVLAGAIAGLLGQGLTLYDAAALGVYLHGAAGARVREELGDAGTLASDLLPHLPQALKALKETAR
ncbi:MAG: NAD(P)H-hydrate dehydratase [Oscillochloridaceae bacterium]|nr:NAD(P)H-hydrate dehydratase [Chloroflexaceae bacterium]MDW8391356.1 NAD(P)H-hydrate dehydratase [Oscillochloridaceae bacterium]